MRRLFAAALVLVACDRAPSSAEGESAQAAEEPEPAPVEDPTTKEAEPAGPTAVEVQIAAREPPDVVVVSPGRNPREDLRLRPTAGTTEALEIVMKTRMSMQGSAGKIPPTGLPAIVMKGRAIVDSADDRQIAFRHEVDAVTVRDDADAPQPLVETLRGQMAEFEQYKASLVVDAKGGLRSGTVYLPQSAAPPVNQMMNQVTESFGQIQVPLPREPVGVGATWKATVTIEQSGLKLEQVVDYELTKREGDLLMIKATFAQRLVDKTFAPPGLGGMKAKITKFDSEGSGTMNLDLTHLVPTHSDVTMNVKMGLEVDLAGQPQTQDLAMVVAVAFSRS